MTSRARGGSSRVRLLLAPLLVVLALAAPRPASAAQPLTCAAEPRPGFADADEETGKISGLAVDLCRAVAIATRGPGASVRFALPESEKEFAALRTDRTDRNGGTGGTDLAFLTEDALESHGLRAQRILGPTVFIDPVSVMVPLASPAQRPADLAGTVVCVMTGSQAERALNQTLSGLAPPLARQAYSEDVEMLDAYNVGSCTAAAANLSRLAEMHRDAGINQLQSRVLMPPLALTPIFATAPATHGRQAALAFAVLADIVGTPEKPSAWTGTPAAIPGTRPGWHAEVEKALGSFAAMRARNLGRESAFGLPAWPNAAWPDGLLMPLQK